MTFRALLYIRVRSGFERIGALIACVLLSPLLLVISGLVFVTSGRPVIFRQRRVGRGGRDFEIIKFRTMVRNAEELGGGYFAPDLQLVTRFGRFLRQTSLDELPQLVNIVRGEMAFVGPRPALRDQYERYTGDQRRRVSVPPGVTGLAQITYRNDAPWSKRIELDLRYIDEIGPRIDAVILIRTVSRVVRREGVRLDQAAEDVDDL